MAMSSELSFIGKNIRLLRRSRNWNLSELASRIGIHKGPLGRIERGLNLPSAAVLYKLATVFDVSVDTLFASESHHGPVKSSATGDTCFISMGSESAAPPKSILKACVDIMAAFHGLEDICKAQKHAFLPLSIPFNPSYEGMEELAARVRNYLGTGDAVVFDYFELFENAGLRIILFPFTRGADQMDSISFYEPAFQNAFFFLNSRRNPEKQIFSLSCELGKILVSNQIKLQHSPLFTPPEHNPGTDRPITPDRAARRFAATFLMPETAVRATASQLGISKHGWSWELLLRIKHRFGVSAQAFLYRLHELDLISDPVKEQLDTMIKDFYNSNDFKEPDSTRRCLMPNGRLFDLLLTAGNTESARTEVSAIKQLINKLKVLPE
jgi:Zn-dependent peptidase ImmA (M78 family)/transcriptional regulator with XRE-family HTH domain